MTVLTMDSARLRSLRHVHGTKHRKQDYENNNYITYKHGMLVTNKEIIGWFWCYLAIGSVSIICYVNNIHGDFVHDDIKAITTNPDVRGETAVLELFTNDFWGNSMLDTTSHKSYRPICILTFRLNYWLGGLEPEGFHITNNLLHCIATLLFTHICRKVIFHGDIITTSLAGLLFAVHPVHTEAVSSLVGRADILSCIFFLLGFISYHNYRSEPHLQRAPHSVTSEQWRSRVPRASLFWTVFCATLAMLSKEQGITIIGVCLLIEIHSTWLRWTDSVEYNRLVLQRATICATKLTISLMFLMLFRLWMLSGSFPCFQEEDNPASFSDLFATRILTYTYLWAFNGWLMLCPVSLSHDWQMGSIPLIESISDIRNIASLLLLVLSASCMWKILYSQKVENQQKIFYGLTLAVLPFLPASNMFVTVGFVVAERVLYMPSLGLIVLVVHGADCVKFKLLRHWRHLKVFGVILLVLFPACRTITRNQVWDNRHTLARSGIKVLPHNAKMHYNYANVLVDLGDTDTAISHYQTAIRLWPKYASAHNNLAIHIRNKSEAMSHLAEAIRLVPCHANAYTNMANIYYRHMEDNGRAVKLLKLASKCEVHNPSPHLSLAAIYQDLGMISLAERHYRTALVLAPTQTNVHHNVAGFFESIGDHESAIKHLEKATSLDPYSHTTMRKLGNLYQKNGQYDLAEKCFTRSLRVSRDQNTLDMIGVLYYNTGRLPESVQLFKEAYSIGPITASVIIHLARALAFTDQLIEAEILLRSHISDYAMDMEMTTLLANIYGLLGEHLQAVELLQDILNSSRNELSSQNISVIHNQIGNHFKDVHVLDKAARSYQKAICFDSSNAEAHHNLAVYYHRKNKHDEALHHYQEAAKLTPDDQLLQKNYRSLLVNVHTPREMLHRSQNIQTHHPDNNYVLIHNDTALIPGMDGVKQVLNAHGSLSHGRDGMNLILANKP